MTSSSTNKETSPFGISITISSPFSTTAITSSENEVIHSLEKPLFTEPGLKILKGNLSPKGAIVRPTAVPEEVKYMKGKAKVYETDRDAFNAIMAGKIVPGDIIVIRYEGCKGAPGMKELMLSIDALI
uniref:dihydroxy-acid dehydratase domain-containing protein n=1 Tax=Clostridium perfringens TaxID=1502 RepID=UPI002ACC38EB